MSELKAYMYDDMIDGDADTNIEYYPKSEADKVIAEKDAEIERLRGESCKLTDGCLRLKQCRKEKANIADKLRHSNRKRCLAMAWWCDSEMNYWYERIEMEQCQRFKFYDKWHKRWLELAKKFKEWK